MDTVDSHHAESHLAELLERVERGDEIVIVRAGRPIARLIAYRIVSGPRIGGQWRDRVRIADDFDTSLPTEVTRAFGLSVPADQRSIGAPPWTDGTPSTNRSR